MIKLLNRHHSKEFIDQPLMDAEVLRQTYQEIKAINLYTLGFWPTMSAVNYFLSRFAHGRVISILDIGCGDGELLRRIEDLGCRKRWTLKLTGIDLNGEVISAARELSGSSIDFINGDILTHENKSSYDLIINSLTTHHLTDQQIITLMQWMTDHAEIGWSISDLNRRAIAYYFIKYFVRLGGFNRVVCHDAPLSVARSFRRSDWIDLTAKAGLNPSSVKISWYPNFRYGVRYEKSI